MNVGPCKICDKWVSTFFNVNFHRVPICEDCATAITIQQIKWWAKRNGCKVPHDHIEKDGGYLDVDPKS
jgi:hypothetical protein